MLLTKTRRTARRKQPRVGKTNAKLGGGESKMMTPFRKLGPQTIFSRISQCPDREFVRLRYCEPPYSTGTLTGGSVYVDKYALNSVFDPYLGTGGGQPGGLARMFAQYKYVRVWGSTITLKVGRSEHDSDYPYDVALVPITYGGAGSPPSILSTYIEQPYALWKRGCSVYADQPHVLTSHMETAKLAGLPDVGIYNTNWYHDVTANATYTHEWHVVVTQPIALVNNTNLEITVEITYDCEFFMRLAQPTAFLDKVISKVKDSGLEDEVKEEFTGDVETIVHRRTAAAMPVLAMVKKPARTLSSAKVPAKTMGS